MSILEKTDHILIGAYCIKTYGGYSMPATLFSMDKIFDELFPRPAKAERQKDRPTADNHN